MEDPAHEAKMVALSAKLGYPSRVVGCSLCGHRMQVEVKNAMRALPFCCVPCAMKDLRGGAELKWSGTGDPTHTAEDIRRKLREST